MISKEEAIASLRARADAEGRPFEEPWRVTLERVKIKSSEEGGKPIEKYVYRAMSGNTRPPRIVEVDAVDGTILEPRFCLR